MLRKRKRTASSRRRRPAGPIALIVTVLSGLALVIRVSLRDRFPLVATLYYATPWPIISFLLLLSALMWLRIRRRTTTLWMFSIAVATTAWSASINTRYRAAAPAQSMVTFRVMSWNVARGGWSATHLKREIQTSGADVVGLVETGANSLERMDFWTQTFRDRNLSRFASGMLLATKYPILEDDTRDIGVTGRCRHFLLQAGLRPVHFLLVDIKSNPLISREEPLLAVARVARDLGDQPLVVMGDFNTPGDSVWFEPVRSNLRDAFELAGCGYRPTWPVPLPVLDLDHVWINQALEAIKVCHGWSIASDHRPIIADLAIR